MARVDVVKRATGVFLFLPVEEHNAVTQLVFTVQNCFMQKYSNKNTHHTN